MLAVRSTLHILRLRLDRMARYLDRLPIEHHKYLIGMDRYVLDGDIAAIDKVISREESLDNKNMRELRIIASRYGVVGFMRMRKLQLLENIRERRKAEC